MTPTKREPLPWNPDAEQPPITPAQRVMFWKSELYRAIDYGDLQLNVFEGGEIKQLPPFAFLNMVLENLHTLLEGSPRTRKLLGDVWDYREDKELLLGAIDAFQVECNRLLVPEEQRPYEFTHRREVEKGSYANRGDEHFRETRR